MVRRIIWSSMAWPAFLSLLGLVLFDSSQQVAELLGWVAGLWAGTLLVCAAFWRFGWRRSAASQLWLWGLVGGIGAIVWLMLFSVSAIVIANVLPITPTTGNWLIALWTPMGLLAGAGLTALNIGGRLRKEDYRG
jgi:hypothetical protein